MIDLAPEEVIVTETPREGWSVASDAGATVALDLEITEELRRAGLARDAIRLIQEARKNSGLDVADRIALRWTAADPAVAEALGEHAGLIADEVLATDFATGTGDESYGEPFTDEALTLTFRLRRVPERRRRAAPGLFVHGGPRLAPCPGPAGHVRVRRRGPGPHRGGPGPRLNA